MSDSINESFFEQDKKHFIHPYTDFSTFDEEGSQVISSAKGAYVTDNNGTQFLDGIAGLWCVNIGHGRKEMADAIAEQIVKMEYYNPFGHSTNEPAAALAAKLAKLAPGNLNRVFYGCGGSVANDTAVRLVHYYFNMKGQPSKKKIISRINGYHGSTYLASALTGIQGIKYSFDEAENLVEYVSAANMYRRPKGTENFSEEAYCDFLVDEFENRILQVGPDKVAAFIAEPIMGAGGVLVAPAGYHKRIYNICKKYDIFFISDEVVTAFGRLGEMISSESIYGFTPDILCMAKGITSGYLPLGVTMISDDIYDVISKPQCDGGLFSHGFTYSGHPTVCAAALKNIEILENEKICEHVKEIGPYFFDQAQKLMNLSIVGDVRGSHLMVGIELVEDKETKELFPAEAAVAHRIFKECLNLGVIVRPVGNVIVLSPPLIFTKEQTDTLFSALRASIETITNQLI
jgi:adenosylmethionine-8-amino-7-oxononanoate aminotransferase